MKECYANFKGARALVVLALALAAALATVSIAEGTEALSEYDAFSVDGITYEVEYVDMKQVYIDHYQGNPTHIFGTVSYDGSIWTVDSMISNAFMNCKSLISVDLSGASNVAYSAFCGCSNLKEVNLPKADYIGDYAFQGCNALTHIKFSESLLNVEDEAFSVDFYSEGELLAVNASSLLGKEFVGSGNGDLHEGFAADSPDGGGKILYGVTDYASHSVGIVGFEEGPAQISGTVSYGGFDWTVVSVGDNALKGCTCMKFVDLPEAVSIGDGAFYGCLSLRNVRFSSSLAIVGTDAFQMKFRSEGDAIASDADHLRGKEFVGYGSFLHEGFIVASPDGEGDILLKISAAKPKYVDIVGFEGNPSQVSGTVSYGGSSWTITSVSNDAFYGCQSLETADLPNATELGADAFCGCTSLKEINISHTTYISDNTFNGCTSLRYMDLQSVVDLNENAFYDCLALSHISFSDKLDNVGMDVFSVDFYSEGELLAADAGSLRGRTFTGDGDGRLYESFEISWLDDSGALADTTLARKGVTPSHDGLTKEPTDRYTYEFAGWSPEPVPASGEESYTAVFDAAVRTYPVQVSASPYGYGTVSVSEVADVPYGTALPEDMSSATISLGETVVTAEPAKADAYVYSFVRWEASGLVDGATGTDTALTAVFDRTPVSDEKISVEVVVAKASGSSTSMSFRVPSGTVAVVDGTSLALGGIRLTNPVPQDDERYAYSFSGWTMDGVPLLDGKHSISGGCVIASSIVATERTFEVTIKVEGSGAVSKGSVDAPYSAPVYAEGRVLHVGDEAVEATPAAPGEDSMPVFLRWEVPSVQVTGPMTATAVFGERPMTFVVDSVVYRIVSDGEVSAVGFEGSPVSLSVPSSVENGGEPYAPTSIADSAFAGCATVTSVSIGDSVASIGDGALDSPYLRSVEVSSGNAAYSSIAGVLYDEDAGVLLKFPASKQRLVIPSTVTEIAAGAFQNAGAALKADHDSGPISYFRYVSIPASVTRIGEGAFASSTLEVLRLADGTEAVGARAFAGCGSLSYVVFNETLGSVAPDAFEGCSFHGEDGNEMAFSIGAMSGHKFTGSGSDDLTMYVPEAGGTIASGGVNYRITDSGAKHVYAAGPDGEGAAEVSIPASVRYLGFDWMVTSVGPKAFMGCGSITSVSSAVDVGFKSFAKCAGLESVSLGGAGSIGGYAFFGCASLSAVSLGSVASVGESAFSGCASLSAVDQSGVQTVGDHAFYRCALREVDLSSATSVGYGAFTGNCLERAVFGDSLSSVDLKAFFGYSFLDPDGGRIAVSASTLAGKTFEGSGKVLVQTS